MNGPVLLLLPDPEARVDLGRPVLVGPSRKRFIGTLLDVPEDERVEGTAGAVAWLVAKGARIVRVHDVKAMARVVKVVDAIAGAGMIDPMSRGRRDETRRMT